MQNLWLELLWQIQLAKWAFRVEQRLGGHTEIGMLPPISRLTFRLLRLRKTLEKQ